MLLAAAILSLFLGPLVADRVQTRPGANSFLDGFILFSVGGLVLFHLLPDVFHELKLWALVLIMLGALLPGLAEYALHQVRRQAHLAVLLLALGGIVAHTLLDGAALAEPGKGVVSRYLAWGVVLHRFPVGLLVWWALRPFLALRWILLLLGCMATATVGGYFFLGQALEVQQAGLLLIFQAVVTGSLLHILLHRQHGQKRVPPLESLGALLAIGLLVAVSHLGGLEEPSPYADLVWRTALQVSPAVLVGFAVTFLVVWLFLSASSRAVGQLGALLRSIFYPSCPCRFISGELAVKPRLMQAALLTPAVGAEVFALSLPLLGWRLTLWRLVLVVVTLILVSGSWVYLDKKASEAPTEVAEIAPGSSTWPFLWHEMVDHVGPWLVGGVFLAAALAPVDVGIVSQSLPTWLWIGLGALVGIPLFWNAAGATFLAAVLLHWGWSPGAVMAFLITASACGWRFLNHVHARWGWKKVLQLAGLMWLFAAMAGGVTELFYGSVHVPTAAFSSPSFLQVGSLLLISGMLLISFMRQGPRGWLADLGRFL